MTVFKLLNTNEPNNAIYIKSDMSKEEICDIIVGLQFYLEDNTIFGTHIFIHENIMSYLMCEFFSCKLATKKDIIFSKGYNKEYNDITKSNHINIYNERDKRCGSHYKDYEENILHLKDSKFIQKLCTYYNDESVLKKYLTTEQILEKY